MIFRVILLFAIHFFLAFIFMYCNDKAKIWADGREIYLRSPSITDLNSLDDKYMVDKYVKEVIAPYHYYFEIRNKIIKCQEDSCGLTGLVVQGLSLVFIIKNTQKLIPNENMSNFLYIVLIITACLTICCLGCYILWKLYKKSNLCLDLYNDRFNYSREELEQRFVYNEKEFNISREDAFNNYALEKHYHYLHLIEDSVATREKIRDILEVVAGIIYLLFVPQKY